MSIQNKNLDFTGFTKGIIKVLENVGSSKKGRLWRCKCTVCGFERIMCTNQITSGRFEKCLCKQFKQKQI